MTTLREAAQQALEALDAGVSVSPKSVLHDRLRAALPCTYKCEAWPECACAALAQQEQEPVAWRSQNATPPGGFVIFQQYPQALADLGGVIEPLYTTPLRREWQSLTEDEIRTAYGNDLKYRDGDYERFARAIEAKLKEKNS